MIVNGNSIIQCATQIKNRIMINVTVHVKSIIHAKKNYSWNPSKSICENGKYLESVVDD